MNHRHPLQAIQRIATLALVVAGLGCSLLKSSDEKKDAAEATAASQAASVAGPSAAPTAPIFDIQVPAASNAPSGVVAAHHAAETAPVAGHVTPHGTGGTGPEHALIARATGGNAALVHQTHTTRTTSASTRPSTTVATLAAPTTSPATAGLLAVGQRTAANSAPTSTARAATTSPVATAPPPSTAPTTPSTTPARRRESIFNGSGLISAGGARQRGNRTVDAPTRQGVQ
jgi:hypothetical protein